MPTDRNDPTITESLKALEFRALQVGSGSRRGQELRHEHLQNIVRTLKDNIKGMQHNLNISTQQINKIQRIELYEQHHAIDACEKELDEQTTILNERITVADKQTKELDKRMTEIFKQHGNLAHLKIIEKKERSMLKHIQEGRLILLAELTQIVELRVQIIDQRISDLKLSLEIRNQHITLNKKDEEMEKEIEKEIERSKHEKDENKENI